RQKVQPASKCAHNNLRQTTKFRSAKITKGKITKQSITKSLQEQNTHGIAILSTGKKATAVAFLLMREADHMIPFNT
ncbi:MAG TPA: hypothetical protein VJ066_04970, partial [Candidatus Bathyarchaeia archaeon]|nr:hypothetical protein [Candidatus Bathyarchaeia archaeon]